MVFKNARSSLQVRTSFSAGSIAHEVHAAALGCSTRNLGGGLLQAPMRPLPAVGPYACLGPASSHRTPAACGAEGPCPVWRDLTAARDRHASPGGHKNWQGDLSGPRRPALSFVRCRVAFIAERIMPGPVPRRADGMVIVDVSQERPFGFLAGLPSNPSARLRNSASLSSQGPEACGDATDGCGIAHAWPFGAAAGPAA